MGVHVVRVPDIGEGVAEAELVAWHVKPGDAVAEDQALADVMTDKATVEIPSPVAGKVLALGGEVGQMLAVGADLIRIDTAEVSAGSSAPIKVEAPQRVPETAAVAAAPQPRPAPKAAPKQAPSERPIASPSVRRRA